MNEVFISVKGLQFDCMLSLLFLTPFTATSGLLSWVGGNKNRSYLSNHEEGEFLITLTDDANQQLKDHLVFGAIDLLDPESATTLDNLEQILRDERSVVRISAVRLVSFQFKDILDGTYLNEVDTINWRAVRSLLGFSRCHPRYEGSATWLVAKNRYRFPNGREHANERNIAHATLYHKAPLDILIAAVSVCSASQIVAPDPQGGNLPLSLAFKRSVDRSIILAIISKMDELPDSLALDAYKSVVGNTYIADLKKGDLLLLLDKIHCDRQAILNQLVEGWEYVRRENESFDTRWQISYEDAIESAEGLLDVLGGNLLPPLCD